MINNTELIRSLLKFDKPDDFYFLQVIKRRKDNPNLGRDMKMIDIFYIYSFEEFDRKIPKIIEICDLNNARAYIHLNVRNAVKVGLYTLRLISDYIIAGDYKSIKNAYNSACGQYHSDPDKKWIIDVDEPFSQKSFNFYAEKINSVRPEGVEKIKAMLPTKNGYHIITLGFDLQKAGIDKNLIQKENPTLLYIP